MPDAFTGCPITTAATGREHTCAVDVKGNVWCFGRNEFGESIPGGPPAIPEPMRVPLAAAAVEVVTGREFSCARLDDGRVQCWGFNAVGQLGDGTMTQGGPTFVQLGAERAIDLVASSRSACIRRASDSAVMCWGDGGNNRLGQTATTPSPTPVLVANTAGATAVGLGHCHGCIIDAANVVRCWGRNDSGQLGDNGFTTRATVQPVVGLGAARAIVATGHHSCAIEVANGGVRCWGANSSGELGIGDYMQRFVPTSVAMSDAVSIALPNYGTCGVGTDGIVKCWGSWHENATTPTPTMYLGAEEIYAGNWHICMRSAGRLLCWGSNEHGERGTGVRSLIPTPIEIALPASATSVSVANAACAVAGGELYCWGPNDRGQLATGAFESRDGPVRVDTGLPSVQGVAAGSHVCAWGGGVARCWGQASLGELAIAPPPVGRVPTPTPVAGLAAVSAVDVGSGITCAIDGARLACWGTGELGDGMTSMSTTPVTVPGIANPVRLSIGGKHICTIIDTGVLYCWGGNGGGQVGDGTKTTRRTPFAVAIPGGANEVAAGDFMTCAISTTGALYCWGLGGNGRLGLGETSDHTTPAQVTLPAPAVTVAAGAGGACARLMTGDVYCWGTNKHGQLGLGTTDEILLTPTRVPAYASATAISRGENTCAIVAGKVLCAGRKRDAGLADAPIAPARIPACD